MDSTLCSKSVICTGSLTFCIWLSFSEISLIATPGRLLHLIVEMDLDLKSVQYIVFDEADRYAPNFYQRGLAGEKREAEF